MTFLIKRQITINPDVKEGIIIIPYIKTDMNFNNLVINKYNLKNISNRIEKERMIIFNNLCAENNLEYLVYFIDDTKNIYNEMKKQYSSIYNMVSNKEKDVYHVIYNKFEDHQGLLLKIITYKFDTYKTQKDNQINIYPCQINSINQELFQTNVDMGFIVNFCRRIQKEPGNYKTPYMLTKYIENAIQKLDKNNIKLQYKIYDLAWIEKNKMGGLLAVSKGGRSAGTNPYFMLVHYNHENNNIDFDNLGTLNDYICLVGKGITFDSGGIDLKGDSMLMHMDMSGLSTCIGITMLCSLLKIKTKILCVLPICDNMPSGNAYKPGDVITHYDGTTSEIHNTDAEGRVILGDALGFANKLNPKLICDFASLTGLAQSITGSMATVLFSSKEEYGNKYLESSQKYDEKAVVLPMWDDLKEYLKSDVADIKNSGYSAGGDTMMAMCYLWHFVENKQWMHFDLATTITSKSMDHLNGYGKSSVILPFVEFIKKI
jgi:leucyl aminopeptidase